jgi:hypothetical protein
MELEFSGPFIDLKMTPSDFFPKGQFLLRNNLYPFVSTFQNTRELLNGELKAAHEDYRMYHYL